MRTKQSAKLASLVYIETMASFIGFSTSHKTSTSEKKLHCCNKLKTSPLVITVGFSGTIFKRK